MTTAGRAPEGVATVGIDGDDVVNLDDAPALFRYLFTDERCLRAASPRRSETVR